MASKFGLIATLIASGATALTLAAAPAAFAAAIAPDDTTSIDQRPGHAAIVVTPPAVSDARSYGQFSSPAPFFGE